MAAVGSMAGATARRRHVHGVVPVLHARHHFVPHMPGHLAFPGRRDFGGILQLMCFLAHVVLFFMRFVMSVVHCLLPWRNEN